MAQYEYRDGKFTGRELLSEEEHQKKQFLPIALAVGLVLLIFGGLSYLFGLILSFFGFVFDGISKIRVSHITYLYKPLKIIFWMYVIFSLFFTTFLLYEIFYKQ